MKRCFPQRGARTLGAIATAAWLVAGCAGRLGPAPASGVAAPAHWRAPLLADAPIATAGADMPIDPSWWDGFGDPALAAIVRQALEHNGDLAVARARLAEFYARVGVAHARTLPVVGASAGPARARSLNGFGQPFDATVLAAQVDASVEIDLWGRLAAISESAVAAASAERAGVDATAQAIAASSASAYLVLRGLDAQLDLAESTLRARQRSLDIARRAYDAGYASQLEWLQASAEFGAAAEAIAPLDRSIFEQENALAMLTGGLPASVPRGLALAALTVPEIPAGLPSTLLARRPDIHRAALLIAAQSANAKATSLQLMPTLRLTAAGGIQARELHDLANAPLALWRLGAGMAAPLFDGGSVQAQTDAAAAQRDQAIYQYDITVRAALVDTENSLAALTRLREQARINAARCETARQTLRIAHQRYRNGYSAYLDELDAQRTLYAAETGRVQLQTRILLASVDLYRALGGGWRAAP